MILSTENRDEQFRPPEGSPEPFKAIDRNEFSENALALLDRYHIDNANDPMVIFLSIADKMNANQREVISRFEAAIAFADVEFGRIDLAIGKAEEIQKQVEALTTALAQTLKDFELTTDKIRKRSNCDIMLNHLTPCIYGFFGATLTLLVVFIILRVRLH